MLQTISQDLTAFNTLGLPSQASAFVRFESLDGLPQLSELAEAYPRRFVLGGGSNVVLGDRLDCLVIKVASHGIRLVAQTDEHWIVEAQAGEAWHGFVDHCLAQGWYGLENLALIPGTVGAAPVQNIGAYGVELDQRFDSLVAWDLKMAHSVEMSAQDCGFSYRNSFFKQAEPGRWLIVSVRFRLPRKWEPVLAYPDLQRHAALNVQSGGVTPRQVFDAVCEVRRGKLPDPAVLGNAGSFFKNPLVDMAHVAHLKKTYPDLVAYPQADGNTCKLAAGWMIDRAGWKGRRLGPVGTHARQALVLVNYGGATSADVAHLAEAIKTDVASRFGVMLEQEPIAVPG